MQWATDKGEVFMGKILYVNAKSASAGDGSSWSNALTSLKDALFKAKIGSDTEIWVAKGTYYPTEDDNRKESFFLKSRVHLYGGFVGHEKSRDERDWEKNETILSGAIGADRDDVFTNSLHVVWGADNATLDGFIVEKGCACPVRASLSKSDPPPPHAPQAIAGGEGGRTGNEYEQPYIFMLPGAAPGVPLRAIYAADTMFGAGLFLMQGSPLIRNCIIRDNLAMKGAGVYMLAQREFPPKQERQHPRFENVTVSNNRAYIRGGGVCNDFMTDPTWINSKILDNYCDAKGGGYYSDFGNIPTFINCIIAGNEAPRAAGMGNDGNSNAMLINCTVTGNKAGEFGAAVYQGTYGANMANEMGLDPKDETILYSNVPYLYKSLVVDNSSAHSFAPISSWHDSNVVVKDSIIDDNNGDNSAKELFKDAANHNYNPADGSKFADYGFKDGRVVENIDEILAYYEKFAIPYPYDNAPLAKEVGDAAVIYVKQGGTGDGSSWDKAGSDLHAVLLNAKSGQQIWVAQGTYVPSASGDRQAAFVLREGVELYGGFAGTETALEQRDVKANATILSGDIAGGAKEQNSYHVVASATGAVLDGFTVQDGYADGIMFNMRGAGLIGRFGDSPVIRNCTFKDNYAVEGAAISGYKKTCPVIEDSVFTNNHAQRGGALLLRDGADAKIKNCVFSDNSSSDRGGAAFIDYGACPEFVNCVFEGNKSTGNGGAAYADDNASQVGDTSPTFKTCQFINNSTELLGGAIAGTSFACVVTVENCTFEGNKAKSGSGVALNTMAELKIDDSSKASAADIDADSKSWVTALS
jgi:predicted outer membrane repeat protein